MTDQERAAVVLVDRVAIVTGGATGIGRAIATALVAEGANVILASRDADRGEDAARELGCTFLASDASDYISGTVIPVDGGQLAT